MPDRVRGANGAGALPEPAFRYILAVYCGTIDKIEAMFEDEWFEEGRTELPRHTVVWRRPMSRR